MIEKSFISNRSLLEICCLIVSTREDYEIVKFISDISRVLE